jgi:hypothetical protein
MNFLNGMMDEVELMLQEANMMIDRTNNILNRVDEDLLINQEYIDECQMAAYENGMVTV